MSGDRLQRAIEQLLRDKRPRRFSAGEDEARQLQVAARLHAAHPGADLPSQEFVDELGERLRKHMAREDGTAARLDRRRFLRSAGLAVAAAGAGVAVDRILNHGEPELQPPTAIVPSDGEWVRVSQVSAMPMGKLLRFSAGGVEGVVVRHSNGVLAMSAICTHMGCTLSPGDGDGLLWCPCDNAAFDSNGRSATPDYPLPPLPTIRTRVTGDDVEVFVPKST